MNLAELNLKEVKKPKPLYRRLDLLNHPNIPPPLHGLNPRTIFGKEWWDEKRKESYKRNNGCCHACGSPDRLEGHEVYDISYSQGKAIFIEVVALCKDCHNTVHLGRTEKVLGSKEVSRLKERKTKLFEKYRILEPNQVPWKKWRLIVENKEYEPIHKSEKEWRKHYDEGAG